MSIEELENNPLHGVSAETMVTELVEFYGFDILYAALGLNCFRTNPTISSCLTFMKKTEWAKEKVEDFYLYRFKCMPKIREDMIDFKPRERGFRTGIVPRDPMPLTIEIIRTMQEEAEELYRESRRNSRY